jgi:membrane protease YdiL (CAAX protease family)
MSKSDLDPLMDDPTQPPPGPDAPQPELPPPDAPRPDPSDAGPPDSSGPEGFPPSPHFALVAAIFEGGLAVIAVGLGWLLDIDPMATLRFAWEHVGWALAATLPPLGLLGLCLICPWRPFRRLSRVVDEFMLPLLARCSLAELAVISTLAGLGEEMLFRGIVQAGMARWVEKLSFPAAWPQPTVEAVAVAAGLAAAAVLFGLAHRITNLYAVLAGLIGLYLGCLWLWTGNLLVPIAVHALYDFLALVYLVKIRGGESDRYHARQLD